MVRLSDVKAANAEYVKKKSLIVVSAGGTSGIGQGTIHELCSLAAKTESAGHGLRIYMLGRKQAVVDKLISGFKSLAPKADFVYIPVKDLSLLKGVDEVCQEVTQAERQRAGDAARIDLLVLTQSIFDPWQGRKDTSEGLDVNVSLLYYSRMRMIDQLLPLLTARTAADGSAHVISVHAAGMESSGELFKDDLSLRKHYTFANARVHSVHMTTMFFEHIANDHPGKISLAHVFPGLVIHPAFDNLRTQASTPLWVRMFAPVLIPLAKHTIATSLPESGQRTLFLATARYPAQQADHDKAVPDTVPGTTLPVAVASNGKLGGGAYSCKANDETNAGVEKAYAKLRAENFYDRVWAHTYEAFNDISTGKVFSS